MIPVLPPIALSSPVAEMVISQPFRPGAHFGVDYSVPIGTPVFAAADGVVEGSYVSVGSKTPPPYAYGERVILRHGLHHQTTYNHLSRRLVAKDEVVTRGQLIGFSGNTGYVRPAPTDEKPWLGQHLHYELLVDGRFVDPVPFITLPLPAEQPIAERDLEGVLACVAEMAQPDFCADGAGAVCWPDGPGRPA